MRPQHLISIFCGVSETFNITNSFSSVKNALAAPKIMNLDTYAIFSNALSYARSVKGNYQDA